MKIGLSKIPGLDDLSAAYEALQHRPKSITIDTLALFTQWARFDSRLGEILVRFLFQQWEQTNPMDLKKALLKQPWPQAGAVILEFCQHLFDLRSSKLRDFKIWQKLVLSDIQMAQWEQFYIGQRRIGSKSMLEDALFPYSEYQKWGYLGREALFVTKKRTDKKSRFSINPETRRRIIKSLFATHSRITVKLYLEALGYSISIRQAERDLKSQSFLKSVGNTRGRYYRKISR